MAALASHYVALKYMKLWLLWRDEARGPGGLEPEEDEAEDRT
jgi:hypothetical protein